MQRWYWNITFLFHFSFLLSFKTGKKYLNSQDKDKLMIRRQFKAKKFKKKNKNHWITI
jgi:hypothetical protein